MTVHLYVDVKEETDTKEIPPCMILKSNGATLYNTTDLATIVERRKLFDPTRIIYVVDKRQSLYFLNRYSVVLRRPRSLVMMLILSLSVLVL